VSTQPRPVLITLHDVEPAVRLGAELEREGLKTEMVSPLDDMPGAVKRAKPDVIVVTGDLGDPYTLAIVRQQQWDGAVVIGLTESDDEERNQRFRSQGYAELHAKPASPGDLAIAVKQALDRRYLQRETGLIGESEALREVLVRTEQMAPVSSTVLIEGESGTGKELVARALHRLSSRKTKPFIAVNVTALPASLLESELFGHEKGAFTGAAERRIGRFELAHTGTIFLDEIGDMPPETQVKLLRVLEEREFLRLGGTVPISVDVRVIAATNKPLRQQVEEGTFRSDLFYRLNVLNIHLPPLRERRDDIPHLVRRFVEEFSKEHDRPFHGISAEAMKLLVEYAWPGNVRELRNLIESMVVLSHGREVSSADLPRQIREGGSARWLPVPVGPSRSQAASVEGGRELEFILRSLLELRLQVEDLRRQVNASSELGVGSWESDGNFIGEVPAGAQLPTPNSQLVSRIAPRTAEPPPNVVVIPPGTAMTDVERRVIEAALKEARGSRRKAAEMLRIGERTLYRKIKEYKLPLD
jgi:DNA-binding NtrC family response regulator